MFRSRPALPAKSILVPSALCALCVSAFSSHSYPCKERSLARRLAPRHFPPNSANSVSFVLNSKVNGPSLSPLPATQRPHALFTLNLEGSEAESTLATSWSRRKRCNLFPIMRLCTLSIAHGVHPSMQSFSASSPSLLANSFTIHTYRGNNILDTQRLF